MPLPRAPVALAAAPHAPPTRPLDRFDLYEICVQSPERDARVCRALHGGRPTILRDDFAGPGAVARAWAALAPSHRAVAVDRDPRPLRACDAASRVRAIVTDVRRTRARADVIAALNYAVCEFHARTELLAYLRAARRSLRPGGILVADLYGGQVGVRPGAWTRAHHGPAGERIRYTWEQRSIDELSGLVRNAIHFNVQPDRRPRVGARGARQMRDAFVYDWRLWSIPELREAMLEADFVRTDIHLRAAGAIDEHGDPHCARVRSAADLGRAWSVFVVGRTSACRAIGSP
ncbi:MAG: methyltransferase domain-containing protein [Phycisphaerae bacterium]|nr:methyltransferase domain-containing protein [Phycisphaerae bacterium]